MRGAARGSALPALVLPAGAQEVPGTSPGISGDNCRATGSDSKSQDDQLQSPSDEFASIVQDCRGVLTPPPVGDNDIVQPAPEAGATPVVPPGAVPDQSADPQ